MPARRYGIALCACPWQGRRYTVSCARYIFRYPCIYMNLYHSYPLPKNFPEAFPMIVEIPEGSRVKYEYNHELGVLEMDRIERTPFPFVAAYGFVPQTLGGDGDPLDVLVLCSQPLHPGVVVRVRAIGYLEVNDSGDADEKIIAVPTDDPFYDSVTDLKHVPPSWCAQVEYFYQHYKDLKGKKVIVGAWRDIADTHTLLREGNERYKSTQH